MLPASSRLHNCTSSPQPRRHPQHTRRPRLSTRTPLTPCLLTATATHNTTPPPLPSLSPSNPQGHSIECRINAEDPFQNFRPGPGRVTMYLAPGGPHVRMDSHLYPDYLVPPNYDSLLGKLIVWGEDREQVRARGAC